MTSNVRIIPTTPQSPKNEGAIRALEEALEMAKANGETCNVMVLMKVGAEYMRFSTVMDNPMEVIAQFELAKFDIILGMAGLA